MPTNPVSLSVNGPVLGLSLAESIRKSEKKRRVPLDYEFQDQVRCFVKRALELLVPGTLDYHMVQTLGLALKSYEEGNYPVGAIGLDISRDEGAVYVYKGRNKRKTSHAPHKHAEGDLIDNMVFNTMMRERLPIPDEAPRRIDPPLARFSIDENPQFLTLGGLFEDVRGVVIFALVQPCLMCLGQTEKGRPAAIFYAVDDSEAAPTPSELPSKWANSFAGTHYERLPESSEIQRGIHLFGAEMMRRHEDDGLEKSFCEFV